MDSDEKVALGSTKRVQGLRKMYFSQPMPYLCHEKALATTNVYRETEGEPTVLRRAKSFKRTCETKTILIQDDELIVGTAGYRPRSALVSPEVSWDWLKDELDRVSERKQDPYMATDETKRILKEEVFPYWQGKSVYEYFLEHVPEATKRVVVNTGITDVLIKSQSGSGEFAPGHENIILPKGYRGIMKEAEDHIRRLDPSKESDRRKIDFLKGVCICCESIILLGQRYADEARRMAKIEKSPQRRDELLKIAEICEWVPGNPPRTFHEALQMILFTQIGIYIENNTNGVSPGPFDQYMYPYYKRDIDEGRMTKAEALELIECLWIKLSEITWLHSEQDAKFYAGYLPYQNICVGGMTIDGKDRTNEVSYLCLQATKNIRMIQPSLSVRIHKNTPDEFLDSVCELIKVGTGFPAVFNEHILVKMLLNKGVGPEDAHNGMIVGCVEPNVGGKMSQWSDGGHYNFGSGVEFALSNGYHHVTKQYLGLRTGDPLKFDTFDKLVDAVKKQIADSIKHIAIANSIMEDAHRKLLPYPFVSGLIEGCVANGIDREWGGAKYDAGPALIGTGVADVANSLAAVKKLVHEDKAISMKELIEAIDANFEGYEPLRLMLINRVPKYGNDDDYVDNFARDLADFVFEEVTKYKSRKGCNLISGLYPLTSNVPHGMAVWALPSGRKAGLPLADGISPNPGTDLKGPTAAVKSVAKLDHSKHTVGILYNMKFTPSALKGEKGTKNLGTLIRAYFDLGGFHVQFNVIDTKTLRAAQANPSEYRHLLIRVAGYSAYFVELSHEVQEDIISRTEFVAA